MSEVIDHIDSPETLAQAIAQGTNLATLMDYSEQELEAMYAMGHSLYNQAHYVDALKCFAFLVGLVQTEVRFLSALASTLQMLKRYEEAMQYHCLATLLDVDNPLPLFHTAECFIGMGQLAPAREALQELLGQFPETDWQEVRQRSEVLLQLIRQQDADAAPSAAA